MGAGSGMGSDWNRWTEATRLAGAEFAWIRTDRAGDGGSRDGFRRFHDPYAGPEAVSPSADAHEPHGADVGDSLARL